jgi:YHS domain-containing protein
MKSPTVVKDLVCGMDVESTAAAAYYFCGSKCKEKFDKESRAILGQASGNAEERPRLLRLNRSSWLAQTMFSLPRTAWNGRHG